MIQTIPITKAKDNLLKLITNAHKKRDEYMITAGESSATIISTKELESLRETLEILGNSKLMQDLKEAEEEVKKGNVVSLEEFEKSLKQNV